MDQLIFTLGASASGAAAALIKELWGREEKALDPSFKAYHQKSKESAQKNLSEFLDELRTRTVRFEAAMNEDKEVREAIKNALSDPDFYMLQMNAMIASTRTSVAEKHQILARLVAERMVLDKESWQALAMDKACRAIPYLSLSHLRILGVLAIVYGGRPDPAEQEIQSEFFHDWWSQWLDEMISPLMPMGETREVDYTHLVSNSCCVFEFVGYRNLDKILSPPPGTTGKWNANKYLSETEVGKMLAMQWKAGMQRAYPSSVGRLIGRHVHDYYARNEG